MGRTQEHGAPVELDSGERVVTITSPGKVMFPKQGEIKLDLAHYYLAAGIPGAPWPPVYPKQPAEAPRVVPSRARKDPDY